MEIKTIAGKSLDQWQTSHPLIPTIMAAEEIFWANPSLFPVATELPGLDISSEHVRDAADRLNRFAPYIATVFPETRSAKGIIESPLRQVPAMQQALAARHDISLPGRLLIKCDSHLPISGSIKARGGIYEVLKHAETLALQRGLLSVSDDYACLAEARFTEFFSNYSIAVGSTGNLGLSIGIMGARLGFRVTVHMSADARAWKKEMLRSKGVQVIEYADDYGKAVAEGRRQAAADPKCHFVDDENSRDLFMGYAVAGERLKRQLAEMEIPVDADHPLFVYLPCGVGGGPGGVAFGLKLAFGDAAHCFFVEPTRSPAMLLGLYTGLHDKVSVRDFGLDNITAADGLAVGRPSGFVGKRMQHLMDGAFTVSDETMFRYLALLADSEELYMEPSALAGMGGMIRVIQEDTYLENLSLKRKREEATHIAWGTGGSMVPGKEMESYYRKGRELTNCYSKRNNTIFTKL